MRKQFHLRNTDQGLLAWDVHRLVEMTKDLPVIDLPLGDTRELDEPFWYDKHDVPTCRSIARHAQLIEETDLAHPIIVDPDNRVMDGMHRVCKAVNQGLKTIKAVRLTILPEPDYVNVPVNELPE